MFGTYYDSPETPADPTPVDQNPDSDPEPDGTGDITMLNFDGFATRHPLLVERPSQYVKRLTDAMGSMIAVPEDDQNGGLEGRILFHPAVALPFPVLFGNEKAVHANVVDYPLLHAPTNHPFDPANRDIVHFALTLIMLYTVGGFMREDGDGDLYVYPLSDPFEVDDSIWDKCEEWADLVSEDLTYLNTARMLGFAMQSPDSEGTALNNLFNAWGIQGSQEEIIERGKQAAERLQDLYELYTDLPYMPFQEA